MAVETLPAGAFRPEFALETQPDCGCDACDQGSEDLLQAIDQAIGGSIGSTPE